MSISSAVRKAGPYTGNGSTTAFPFAFKVFAASDLLVVRTDPSAIESTLALGTDYSATLNANQDANPGGVVTLFAAPLAAYLLTIASAVKYLQPVTLTNQGGFYPKVINDALDRATIQIQQLSEEVGRAFKLPLSSTVAPSDTLAGYMVQAHNSADQSAASAAQSANSASVSAAAASAASGFSSAAEDAAAASALSATSSDIFAANAVSTMNAAAASATAAIAAQAGAVAAAAIAYVDSKFIPALAFSSIYALGGWDLGGVTASSFYNETASRRANLSVGSGSFNFGTVP